MFSNRLSELDLEGLGRGGLLGEAAYFTDEETESQRGKEKWPRPLKSRSSAGIKRLLVLKLGKSLNFSQPSFPHCPNSTCTDERNEAQERLSHLPNVTQLAPQSMGSVLISTYWRPTVCQVLC